jgi:hypothetical protein
MRMQASKAKVPDFLIKGQLDGDVFNLDKPMTGELSIKHCAIDIKSIELQLVRVETTAYAEGEVREGRAVAQCLSLSVKKKKKEKKGRHTEKK